jgi:hypothetical protein
MIAEIQDHGFEDTSVERITGFINDAYYDICSREPWPFLEKSTSVNTVAANDTLAVPSDFDKVLRMVIDANAQILEPARLDDVTSRFNGMLTNQALPFLYYFIGDTVKLYPIPDAVYAVTVRYLAVPTELSNNTDTPILPTKHHRAIVLGALVDAYRMEDDNENASVFEAQFEKRIATMATDVWKKQYDRPERVYTLYENDADEFDPWPWI